MAEGPAPNSQAPDAVNDEAAGSEPPIEPGEVVESDDSAARMPVVLEPAHLGIELPSDHDEAVSLLLSELAAARSERDDYLADLKRVAADFDNFRKRVQRDQREMIAQATRRVVESMLPTLDAFDAAATHEPQTEGEEKLLAGLVGTRQQLMDVLAREGLVSVPAEGEPFDPNVHEAVSITGEGTEHVVESEIRKGYKLGDRVLRPALVALSAGGSEES